MTVSRRGVFSFFSFFSFTRGLTNELPGIGQTSIASQTSPAEEITPADLPPDWWVFWDERAAIREYDGGFPREQAEALALADVLQAMERAGEWPKK